MMYFSVVLLVLTLAADALLGLIVWMQATRKRVNIIFALLTLSFIVWSASGFYAQTAQGSDPLLPLIAGVPFIGGIFMAYFITLFSVYFPETQLTASRPRKVILWVLHAMTLPLLAIFIFDIKLMVADITTSAGQGNNIVVGPLYGLFFLYFAGWITLALSNLVYKYRHSKDRVFRVQVRYIFLGLLAMTAVTILTNVILPVLANNPAPARFGFLSTLFIIGFIGYAIANHRLFNIRLLVARSLAYLLLLGTLAGLYGLGIFAISSVFFRNSIPLIQTSAFVVLALFIAFTLQPLRRFFEKITDRIFFRDRYDSQKLLDTVGNILASELLLERILDDSLIQISHQMRLAGGQFVVFQGDRMYRSVHRGSLELNSAAAAELQNLPHTTLVTDELPPGLAKDTLMTHHVSVSLLLRTKEEFVGYLLLGEKLSGELYSNQDLAVLEILRKELAVAILNAKAYEEIARFNQTLQERVHQATQRLRSANRNLKVLDKAKDDFISVASHQLGTPLAAITGFLSMTIDSDKNNLTIQQREYLNYALESAERMVAMSSDLLNVSRINSGRFSVQRQSIDLVKLTEQEVQQLQPSAERKGLKLTFESPSQALPHISLDESKTRQVIMNFIDNAIYYTDTGQITVKLSGVKGRAILTVTDTGMGVPAAEKDKLFTKFYRAENAKTERPDGTGLGLYLAKRVIEDQGGELIFESEVGRGSTFGFSLPLA
jgi:signal transduction histidine kinase